MAGPPGLPEPLQIDTPVIDTRVSNTGARIEPRIDSADERDFAREDRAALEALEQFEKLLRQQLPD